MTSIVDNNRTDLLDNQYAKLIGATDNIEIGNVGDRLKVEASFKSLDANCIAFLDMNASNGGVARDSNIGTTFTNIFSYSGGAGTLFGFITTFETNGLETWFVRIFADGLHYPFFSTNGLLSGDLNGQNLYDLSDNSNDLPALGISRYRNRIIVNLGEGIAFNSSIQIQTRNSAGNRRWRAGFVKIFR